MHGPLTRELFEATKNEIYQYREEPFQLSSGGTSNHYFNCRKITLVPEHLEKLVRVIRDEVLPGRNIARPPAAGGLTLGADPIAVAFALACLEDDGKVAPLIVRKEAKGHGMGRRIEGEWEGVPRVLALDDVITTGGSTLKAIAAFREAGITVEHAVCVVDREEGGAEALAAEGVRLIGVFKKSDFK